MDTQATGIVTSIDVSTITKAQLMDMARSVNPAERQRAFDLYQAWLKAAPNLEPQDRLNATERMILNQMFTIKKPGRK
jgi:Holliday junction resolvase-like predicted endonuclease